MDDGFAVLIPALVMVAGGLVLLVTLVLLTRRPVRRFTRARAELRSGIGQRVATLRTLVNRRRGGAEPSSTGTAGSGRIHGETSERRRLTAT